MKVINKSKSSYSSWYESYAQVVADEFPDYQVVVDGGSWRYYDCWFEVDITNKIINLDFYLPKYINTENCISCLIRDIGKTIGRHE